MRKGLIAIGVIQIKITDKDNRFKKRTWYRLNPCNPFSYLTAVLVLITSIICFGIVGFKDQLDLRNPFVWK